MRVQTYAHILYICLKITAVTLNYLKKLLSKQVCAIINEFRADKPVGSMAGKAHTFGQSGIKDEFEFRYQPNDPARAFQRYDPGMVRNGTPPVRSVMSPVRSVMSPKASTTVPSAVPWRESNSSLTAPPDMTRASRMTDVDIDNQSLGYHSRPDSRVSADNISLNIRDTQSRMQSPASRYGDLLK